MNWIFVIAKYWEKYGLCSIIIYLDTYVFPFDDFFGEMK